MIFQHTIDKVLSGEKTQTRRIVKPTEHMFAGHEGTVWSVLNPKTLGDPQLRAVYETNKEYAVQPGRGKAAVGRILITNIRHQEDVRYISEEDVKAEGFGSVYGYLLTWTQMHDKEAWRMNQVDMSDGDAANGVYEPHSGNWISYLRGQRPSGFYRAWVLEFQLVKG